jgi:hypothetical protein
MLIVTLRVIAGASCRLVLAKWLLWVYLMAEGQRQKATRDILRIAGMVAVRFEHAERALVRSKPSGLLFLNGRGHLLQVSSGMPGVRNTYRLHNSRRGRSLWLQFKC